MVTDPAIVDWVKANAAWLHEWKVAPIAGAVLVVGLGKMIAARHGAAQSHEAPAGIASSGPAADERKDR
jgi:membrane-associated PAP2 superfamily phosphatase